MARTAKQVYDELLLAQPIIFALSSSAALRATMDEYAEEYGDLEDLTPQVRELFERFTGHLDALLDLVIPVEFGGSV